MLHQHSLQSQARAVDPGFGDVIGDLSGIFRRQRHIFIVVFCCSILTGLIYLFLAPKHYLATALLTIDTHKVQVLAERQSIVGDNVVDEDTVQTEIEIIKSSKVIDAVIRQLHLVDDPEFVQHSGVLRLFENLIFGKATQQPEPTVDELQRTAGARFSSNLIVSRVGATYVISIGFRSLEAAKAVRIANAVADAYISDQLDAKYQVTRSAGAWLQDRINELRTQASAAERAVADFKQKNHIVDANGKLMNEQQLSELESQLILARTSTAEAKARVQRVEEVMAQPIQSASVADALNNQIIIKLRGEYLDLAGQEAIWTQKYGAKHLAVVNLRTQMEELRRSMNDEMQKIEESYESDYAIALARERTLQDSLATSVADSQSTNHAEIEAHELESSAYTYRTLYNTFLQRYMEAVQQESFPITEARVITAATLPFEPSDPNKLLVLLAAGMGGVFLSLALAALKEATNRVFRESSQIESALHMSCLATLPALKQSAPKSGASEKANDKSSTVEGHLIEDRDPLLRFVVGAPLSQFTEELRAVKVAVDLNGILKSKKIIGFTSTLPNEGKTTVSANFTRLAAHSGSRAILIDADLRNPSLSRRMAPKAKVGLVDILAGRSSVKDVQLVDPDTGMIFIPAGQTSKVVHTAELLGSGKMKKLVEELNESFDYIVIDLPPLSPIVDVRMTTSLVDSYILVVEWGRTHIAAVSRATSSVPEVQDLILGAVLNKANARLLSRYESYRGLAYGRKYYKRYGYVE